MLIGVGTLLASMVITGFLLGYALDVWLGTGPLLMFVLGVLGFVGGMIRVYKLLTGPGAT
jgi:ATP synthase protein I